MSVQLNKYYVRNKEKTIIFETTDINEAITRSNKLYKAYVLDKFGNRIHISTMTSEEDEQNKKINRSMPELEDIRNIGDTVWLDNAFLYRSSTANMPSGRISGNRYLYDAKLINGRYRITKRPEFCVAGLSFIEGYINAKDIKTI